MLIQFLIDYAYYWRVFVFCVDKWWTEKEVLNLTFKEVDIQNWVKSHIVNARLTLHRLSRNRRRLTSTSDRFLTAGHVSAPERIMTEFTWMSSPTSKFTGYPLIPVFHPNVWILNLIMSKSSLQLVTAPPAMSSSNQWHQLVLLLILKSGTIPRYETLPERNTEVWLSYTSMTCFETPSWNASCVEEETATESSSQISRQYVYRVTGFTE